MTSEFTCPFCNLTSYNPHDARERYCGHCHVFVDGVIEASPAVRRTVAEFARELAAKTPKEAEQLLRTAEVWERGLEPLVRDPVPQHSPRNQRED